MPPTGHELRGDAGDLGFWNFFEGPYGGTMLVNGDFGLIQIVLRISKKKERHLVFCFK